MCLQIPKSAAYGHVQLPIIWCALAAKWMSYFVVPLTTAVNDARSARVIRARRDEKYPSPFARISAGKAVIM